MCLEAKFNIYAHMHVTGTDACISCENSIIPNIAILKDNLNVYFSLELLL